MSDAPVTARTASADALLASVLDLTSAAPLALSAFVSVSAVQWSDDVGTVCIECAHRPRLLLNPRFVAEHCSTPERLAMLLLHELSHISLGHTRLFPRPTPVHNVAFDALINARLVHLLEATGVDPRPYAALFEGLYDARETPEFILRPPPGWPHADRGAGEGLPARLRAVHERLYDRELFGGVTYTEILLALRDWAGAAPESRWPRLMGAHGVTGTEAAALTGGRDEAAAELLAPTLSRLVPEPAGGWGPRGDPFLMVIEARRAERRLQKALEKLLRRVFVRDARSRRITETVRPALSVDPSRDRRGAGRRLLAERFGAPRPMLFASTVLERRPERTAARVYVDVSGSMSELLPRLHAALVALRRLLAAEVFAFSGDVAPTSLADFVAGRVRSTGGTSIDPVLEHASDLSACAGASTALLLTDGFFADPRPEIAARLRARGVALHVGVLGSGPLPEGAWVASATRLPDLPDPAEER